MDRIVKDLFEDLPSKFTNDVVFLSNAHSEMTYLNHTKII